MYQDLERLKQIYTDHDRIDLIMGAIAERPKPGATVGETFSCLIGELTLLFIFVLHFQIEFHTMILISDESISNLRKPSNVRAYTILAVFE